MPNQPAKVIDDVWITTSCNACFNVCAIRVRRKDGKIIDVKGDPDVESSRGKICGKSKSRIADIYNPDRVLRPLKRTNFEKGLGVDPKWVEISWDEAMDTVVKKLAEVKKHDPRELIVSTFDLCNIAISQSFGVAFGTPNYEFYPVSCGNGLHTVFFLTLGNLNAEIDLERCNYIMLWGSQLGHGINNNPIEAIRNMADARRRGAKLVVVDPICGHAAAKADEWIPIRPGTDGALALGMINVMVNDLGICDEPYLKFKTNAPYLVDDSGHYVREDESGKPMIWDAGNEKAVAFDERNIKNPALKGTFCVGKTPCRPAFDVLMADIKMHYCLENVEKITTVPKETIARIAREFGAAARIGSTIEFCGETLPHRPATLEFKRGITHHKNGFFNCFSLQLMNIMVGNLNVPGGLMGTNPYGPMGYWTMFAGKDGMLTSDVYQKASGGRGSFGSFMSPYPPNPVSPPTSLNLRELLPLSGFIPGTGAFTIHDPDKFHIPYRPKAMITCRTNMVLSNNDPRFQADMLKKLDFILSFATTIDETAEFADIILPEAHDFEKYWFFPVNHAAGFQKPGPGNWYFQSIHPAVDPPEGVRNWIDVMMDIAERLGTLPELNAELNRMTGLVMSEDLSLAPDKKYSAKEIHDRGVAMYAMLCGIGTKPELLTEEAPVVMGPSKTPSESFPGAFCDARVPIYLEHLIDVGKEVERVTRQIGMGWWDLSHYDPIARWRPCPAHEEDDDEYDLFVVSSRLPLHGQSISANNPWVDDICRRNRLDYNILLNVRTAREKNIKDGDVVWIESKIARVKGKVRLTGAVHHETVGILGGHLGQWAKGKTISRGKGVHINSLVAHDWKMVGTLTGQLDTCARVKVYKA